MWTPAARAELARESLPYATSLSDAEWAVVAPLLPAPATTGRPRRWPMRVVLDGILYVLRTGSAWRHLPHDFPPWSSVHRWFLRLSQAGVFERLAHALTMADRERTGCEASPSGAILDAQATRSGGGGVEGPRGYDPAKRVIGRKRHALTDTDGRLLIAAVSPADLHDSHGGVAVLRASRRLWPFLTHCFADRAYRGERVGTATTITVEIVLPEEGQKGFAVQPRRWVIERTFGWISRCRRLVRDHEATPSSALAFFVLAASMILVRRLARAL
ncbi:IS5 family transposase [Methylobacterium durans]|uniref:IS5 family transposase n=1 Tax=Methylobacterium durans TaxID=2202825 RepID=A0A2U8W844_9HYPH|nr:IS5 family transposase [Methylobacterium durans]AWN42283.1 IS5 family transposase [Methylobacterium durans]